MKRIIALLLACVMVVTGCGAGTGDNKPSSDGSTKENVAESDSSTVSASATNNEESNENEVAYPEIDSEANLNNEDAEQERRLEAAESYQSLNDPELLRYVQDTVYTDLVKDLDSSEYFVENVEAIYISKQKKAFHSLKGVTIETIKDAEEKLGLKFAKEYADYLQNYGVASFFGHELTGLCSSARLNVVDVTIEERQYNQEVSTQLYVVGETNFDNVVVWQDATGTVYKTAPGEKAEKVGGSLAEYYSREE